MTRPMDDIFSINRNGPWCTVIAGALADAGVRDVIVCPGGRAAMMAMALEAEDALACLGHVDERSAAFMALGIATVAGRPAAVCTTSGSAVANLLPALCEAAPRGIPLVLLTCDRPVRDRPAREPQCTEQLSICRPLLHGQLALDDPSDDPAALIALRKAVLAALRDAPGPVQINIPQIGAYWSTEEEPDRQPGITPQEVRGAVPPAAPRARPAAGVAEVEAAANAIGARPGLKGLILAGPDTPYDAAALAGLIRATGFPFLADVASGLRNGALPALSGGEALVCSRTLGLERTELVIRLGGAPVSSLMQQAMARLTCPVLAIAAHDPGPDFMNRSAFGLLPPTAAGIEALSRRLAPGDGAWALSWAGAEAESAARRERFVARLPWGEVKAAAMICNAAGFDMLHLGNSLSVRHASLLAKADGPPRPVRAARGVNGIDGSLGRFLGELLAGGGRGLALIGDQTAVHDLPALASEAWRRVRGAICIMNNGGGGIFDLASCGGLPEYRSVMRNPPAIDFEAAAAAFGLAHRLCPDPPSLARALAEAAGGEALIMVEAQVPADTVRRDFPRLVRAMTV